METPWKVLGLTTSLLFLELCNGFPINLENSGPDSQAQFLTGLVAVLLAVCSVVLLVGCLCCQRKNGFKEFRDSPVVASVASNLDHGHVNPISGGEFTIFTPISPPHHNNNVFLANQRIVSRAQEDYKYGDIDVTSWFDGTETDFPRTRLKYIRELGKGWFGRVVEGTAQGLTDESNESEWTPVVVRILEASATSRDRVLFLHDATIYRCGRHANILQIFGRSLDTVPLLLLQEYCFQGDMKRYLRDRDAESEKFLSSDLPLLWCCQLTTAVKFLHDRKVTHPDLAARNCQLTNDLSLKLGDYGLSATFYPEDYYQGSPGVPLRWCAPETISYTSTTIQSKKMTMEANVWSLGVTMWEIFDCGEQPYSWLTDDEVISHVLGSPKVRLPRPTYNLIYTDYIYRLMQSCWSTSESRPIISHVDLILADLTQVLQNVKHTDRIDATASIQDFDKRWESLKPNAFNKPDNDYLDAPETIDRKFSASLNNLHGSLDNLLERRPDPMESWLENVASDTGDMSYVHGLSQAIKDLDNAIALENVSSDSSHQPSPVPDPAKQNKLQFKLGQLGRVFKPKYSDLEHDEDSILYMHRTSSESETEDETWKKKIERGVYTEKVRQKSRSVADLMVLTHIDCSESDSETMPSLDYKVNCNGKLRHDNFKFGSEGNLLSVKGTFQDELKKLQEERRDSLLFVPDKFSQSSFSDANYADRSPVKKLIDELNHPSEMIPPQQVYNVFNVSVNQKYPIRTIANESKTGKSISDNLKTVSNENQNGFNLNVSSVINSDIPKTDGDGKTFEDARFFTDVRHGFDYLEDQDENTSPLTNASPRENRQLNDVELVVGNEKMSNDVQNFVVESSQNCNQQTTDSYKKWSQEENEKNLIPADVPKLSQIIQSNVELSGYIMSNQANEVKLKTDDSKHNLTVTVIDKDSGLNTPENSASLEKLDDEEEEHFDFSKMYETSRSRNFPEDNEDASCNASFDSDRSNLMTSDDIKDNKMESTDEEIGDLKDEGPFDVVIHNKGNEFGAKLENSLALNSLEYVPIDENKKDYDTNDVQGRGIESNLLETRQIKDTSLPDVQLYISTSNKNIEDNAINIEEVNSLETKPHIKNIMNVELVNEIKWGTSLDIELNESDVRIDDEIPRNCLEENKQNQFSTNLLNSTRDESDEVTTDDYVENKPNKMQDGDTQNKCITNLSLPNDSKSIESSRSSPIIEANSSSELNEVSKAENCFEGLNKIKTKNDTGEDLISSLNESTENFDLKRNDNKDKLKDNSTHPSEEKNYNGNYTSPSIVQDFLDHEIKNSCLSETKQIINDEEIPSLIDKDILNLEPENFDFGNVHEDKLNKIEHVSSNHPSEGKNYTSRNVVQEFLNHEVKNSSTTFETRKIVNNEEISNLIDNTDGELKEQQPTEIEIEENSTQTFNLIGNKDPIDLEEICVGCIEDLLEEKDGELKEEPTEIEIEEKITKTFNLIDSKDPVDLEQICVGTKLAPVSFEETNDINNFLEANFKFLQSNESNDETNESKIKEVEDNSTKLNEFLSHEIKNSCTTPETKEIANKEETLQTHFVIKEETVNLIDNKEKLGERVVCLEEEVERDVSLQPKIAIKETNAFNSIDTHLDLENNVPKTRIKDFEETRDVNNFFETNFNLIHVDDETNGMANENKLIKEDVSLKINRDLVGEFLNHDDTTNEREFIPVDDISLKTNPELAQKNHETTNAHKVNTVEDISSKNNRKFIQEFLNREIEDSNLDGTVKKVLSQENLMGNEVGSFQDHEIENSNKVVCKENLVVCVVEDTVGKYSNSFINESEGNKCNESTCSLDGDDKTHFSDETTIKSTDDNSQQFYELLLMDKTKNVDEQRNKEIEVKDFHLLENNPCVTLSDEKTIKDINLIEKSYLTGTEDENIGNCFSVPFINEYEEHKLNNDAEDANESIRSFDADKGPVLDETRSVAPPEIETNFINEDASKSTCNPSGESQGNFIVGETVQILTTEFTNQVVDNKHNPSNDTSEELERFIESPPNFSLAETFVNENESLDDESFKTLSEDFDSIDTTKKISNQDTNIVSESVIPITSLGARHSSEDLEKCNESPLLETTFVNELDNKVKESNFLETVDEVFDSISTTKNSITNQESEDQTLKIPSEYLKLTQQFLNDEVENYDNCPINRNKRNISALNNYEASINEEKSNFASTESDTTFDKTQNLSSLEIHDLISIENKVIFDEKLADKSDGVCLKMTEELLKDEMNNFVENPEEINIQKCSINEENSDVVCSDKGGCTFLNITQEFLNKEIEKYEDNRVGNKSISGANSTDLIAMDLNDGTYMEVSKNNDTKENLLAGNADIDEMLRNEIIAEDVPLKYQTFIIDEVNVKEEKPNEIDETPNENFKVIGINTNENSDDCNLKTGGAITSTVLDSEHETNNSQLNVTKDFLKYETLNYKDIEIDFETKIVEPTNHQQTSNMQDVIDKNDSLIYIDEPTKEIASKNDETIDANFQTTTDFLLNEIAQYDSIKNTPVFDLSENQEEIAPNSLTHFTSFTSTPFVKRSMESAVILGASDDYSIDFYTGLKTTVDEAEDLKFSSNFVQDFEKSAVAQKLFDNKKEKRKNDHSDLYSLETWDNFLRKSFDDQDNRMDFHNFNEEPHSLLFLDYGDKSGGAEDDGCNKILSGDVEKVANETYEVSVNDKTYVNEAVVGNETFTKPESVKTNDDNQELEVKSGSWETGGGWFLHPQSNPEEPSGQMVVSQESTTGGDTYVGFSMDDEIMAAIRNELMTKLPHAQRASSDHVEDSEELDSSEKNEVFVRYNVYNTPLSPIPEESCVETDESGLVSPRDESADDDSSDWSVQDNNSLIVFTETLSPRIPDSPAKSHLHPHTPSQDSCCSNDTLFNLEELTNANDQERLLAEAAKNLPEPNKSESTQNSPTVSDTTEENNSTKHLLEVPKINVKTFVTDFLNNERYDQINGTVELSQLHSEENEEVSTTSDIYLTVSDNTFSFGQSVAPLNSPEDRPWKELQASFRSCEESDSKFSECDENLETPDAVSNLDLIEGCGSEIFEDVAKSSVEDYETATEISHPELNSDSDYANVESHVCSESAEEEKFDRFEDMYGPLADIRFSGPCSIQLMTTSFSEGNDLGEEQDWDSGSDSRSSSSGEFIWREGEHEASVKALRAAPQSGNVEDVMPMEDIQEENESTCSSGSECPEFVPSAWDKYATPTKSSLRSPEKTVERTQRNEKNPKGVWFKKQKYHCVYEYPREPDSPVLQSYDLWKPTPDFATLTDWDLDTDTYLPTADEPELVAPETQPKVEKVHNLYHLTTFTDVNTAPTMLDEDFFINGSSRPFDMMGGLTSQFFPGKLTENWNENVTPDSGVEDITPGSAIDGNEYKEATAPNEVESLRNLAAAVAKQSGNKSVELGGLRHTRNKLKLDLPPSPSAFTSSRSFNVELAEEIVHRQVPTFSTFGKSRFLVQHVDTPPDDQLSKNVSFEALPYKPAKQFVKDDLDKERHKIEVVRGEASLLDSADEDSGIDSCTLERKRGVEG